MLIDLNNKVVQWNRYSFIPDTDIETFMSEVSRRAKIYSGVNIRFDNTWNFVSDLRKYNLLDIFTDKN